MQNLHKSDLVVLWIYHKSIIIKECTISLCRSTYVVLIATHQSTGHSFETCTMFTLLLTIHLVEIQNISFLFVLGRAHSIHFIGYKEKRCRCCRVWIRIRVATENRTVRYVHQCHHIVRIYCLNVSWNKFNSIMVNKWVSNKILILFVITRDTVGKPVKCH